MTKQSRPTVYGCKNCERKCMILTYDNESPYECSYDEVNYCWELIE